MIYTDFLPEISSQIHQLCGISNAADLRETSAALPGGENMN